MANFSWSTAANVATFFAATLTVIIGLAAVGVWVQYHFAGQKRLDYVTCVNKHHTDLLAAQVEAANVYSRYINTKVNVLKWKTSFDANSDEQRKHIIAGEEKMDILWKQLTELEQKADEFADKFEERCDKEQGGIIWLAS